MQGIDAPKSKVCFMLVLLVLIVASSLAVVVSSYQSRQLFIQLQSLQKEASRLQVRRGQLLLEESTWSSPALIEQQAIAGLSMRVPSGERLQIVDANTGGLHEYVEAATAHAIQASDSSIATIKQQQRGLR